MEHKDLVNRAVKWLKNTFRCRVVLSELVAYTKSGETPDVIGWVHNRSILIECKSNKLDFYLDKRKRARKVGMPALGHWRFYLTPPNLLSIENIPKGWGLYEVTGKRIFHTGGCKYEKAKSPPFESDKDSEIAMLLSALARTKNQNEKKNF